ncbi:MAG: hypothetical protein E7141_06895 [Rikenellaceae bacterium]|nr:hypothetical protein [Rikenellaceae bacterium]
MKRLLGALFSIVALLGCKSQQPTVEWIEGDLDPKSGLYEHEFIVRDVPTDSNDWVIWFWSQTLTHYEVVESDGLKIELFRARAHMLRPEGTPKVAGEYRIRYRSSAKLWNKSKFPIKLSYQNGTDKPINIDITYKMLPLRSDGEEIFNKNAAIALSKSKPEHIVPCLKSIEYRGEGVTDLSKWERENADVTILNEQHPKGWYRITLDGAIKIEAADEYGAYYAATTLENIKQNGSTVDNMVIEDYPDFDIRGFMMHVASTHQTMDSLYRLVDLMARYKLNVLHMHLTDDYGWRIEIDDIPDLTSVGARTAIPQPDGKGWFTEEVILSSSSLDKDDMSNPNNRHYTREDYIALVKYAAERKIRVLPEIDFPGHSRAAVIALRAYERRTGDTRFTPTHKDDTSVFSSVQGVSDNTFDIALESTYNFITLVFDNLIEMHNEAGVPLTEIHIGGDEVPEGAWIGSPACQALLARSPKGADEKEVFYSYFINRVLDIAEARNIKICGWHEIVEHLDQPTWKRMAKHCAWINFWGFDRMLPIAQKAVENSVNVVLSNCQTTYLEEMHTLNKQEPGNGWAGPIDIKTAFSLDPFNPKYPYKDNSRILGVQTQLWHSKIDHFVFPKGLGNFDRAWNAAPQCSYDHYYSTLVYNELPYLESRGVKYHIAQPGLKIEDGKLIANAPFEGGEIRYTLSEETPTTKSTLWSEPIEIADDVKVISARYFKNGRESVTTTLRR